MMNGFFSNAKVSEPARYIGTRRWHEGTSILLNTTLIQWNAEAFLNQLGLVSIPTLDSDFPFWRYRV